MSTPSLYQIQQEILNYLHNKTVNAKVLDSSTQEDLSVYQTLVLNSMEEMIESIYPFTYKILEDNWSEIISLYAALYPSRSPIYNHLAKDFAKFLASKEFTEKYNYPNYLAELAEYEWTDLEIYNALDLVAENDVNPVHKILQCKFPITEILHYLKTSEDDIAAIRETDIEEAEEIVLVYRDSETCNTRFFKLSKAVYLILEGLKQGQDLPAIQTKYFENFGQRLESAPLKQLIEDLKKINILIK